MTRALRWVFVFSLFLTPLPADFAAGLRAYQAKDYVTAAREWAPIAESGDSAAQFNLGLLYLDGTGVPQDVQQAVMWFRRSADQGYVKAQKNLGNLYALGQGVKRDYTMAHMWLNLCAATGDEKCAAQRDLLGQKMKAKDLSEAQRRASSWRAIPEGQKDKSLAK
jgi:TPR repeat protein